MNTSLNGANGLLAAAIWYHACTLTFAHCFFLFYYGFTPATSVIQQHDKSLRLIYSFPLLFSSLLGSLAVRQVACGKNHTMLLTESGDVYTFGASNMGQCGHGHTNTIRVGTHMHLNTHTHKVHTRHKQCTRSEAKPCCWREAVTWSNRPTPT